MDFYIQVSFWMGVAAIVLRSLVIFIASYPRVTKTTLGEDVLSIGMSVIFAVWAYRLLWT